MRRGENVFRNRRDATANVLTAKRSGPQSPTVGSGVDVTVGLLFVVA